MKRCKYVVREGPVIFPRAGVRREIGRTVAQMPDSEFLQKSEIVPPAIIMPGLGELILTDGLPFPLDSGVTVLDPSGKHKLSHRFVSRKNIQPSAIHHKSRASDEARFRGGEETNRSRNVLRLADRAF